VKTLIVARIILYGWQVFVNVQNVEEQHNAHVQPRAD
jgi:hypothetical protein